MGKPGLTCEPLRGRLWWPMPAPVGPEGSGRLLPKSAGVSFARAEACQDLLEAAAEQLALVPGEDLEAMQALCLRDVKSEFADLGPCPGVALAVALAPPHVSRPVLASGTPEAGTPHARGAQRSAGRRVAALKRVTGRDEWPPGSPTPFGSRNGKARPTCGAPLRFLGQSRSLLRTGRDSGVASEVARRLSKALPC